MIVLKLKDDISQSLREKKPHYLGFGSSKLEAAHPVTYFPWFLGKNIKNYPPSKLFLFTTLQTTPLENNNEETNESGWNLLWLH